MILKIIAGRLVGAHYFPWNKFKNRKILTGSDDIILRIFIATKIRKIVHRAIFMHLHNVHDSVLAEMTLEPFVPICHYGIILGCLKDDLGEEYSICSFC